MEKKSQSKDRVFSENSNNQHSLVLQLVTVRRSVKNAKKANSIVSGKEPENTNKLLQVIGKCILDKKSSDEAVEQLKNGGKKTEKESKPKEESRRKEKEPSQEKGFLSYQ